MDFIKVQEHRINVDKDGFICLTDMAKGGKPQMRASDVIRNWLLTKTTVEFLTAWEVVNNPNFKTVESHGFIEKPERMKISNWIYDTGAVGIYSKLGVGGGTYAHKDIAFEFGAHISPMFKLHVIKEYQRLKEIETNLDNQDWQIRRMFSKENFFVMGDAVKNYKIPMKPQLPSNMMGLQYAEECDAVNLALFGFTAATWRKYNVLLAAKNENVRFYASTNELNILSNLEAYNAVMIKEGLSLLDRTRKLTAMAREQLAILNIKSPMKSLKKRQTVAFKHFTSRMEYLMVCFLRYLLLLTWSKRNLKRASHSRSKKIMATRLSSHYFFHEMVFAKVYASPLANELAQRSCF